MYRRVIGVLLVLGLVAGAGLVPAQAKKKKKKVKMVSVDTTFFQRRVDCNTDGFLSLEDAEDPDCGPLASMLGVELPYPAADGTPFNLDATKPITGVITMRNFNQVLGAGSAEVDLVLTGSSGGESVDLGTFSASYLALPAMAETIEYEIEPDSKWNRQKFDSFTLTVVCGGVTVGVTCVVEHDEPVSHVVVPTWEKKKK